MLQPAHFSFCFKRCHIPKKKHFFLPRWKLHTHKVSHPFFIKVCWKPKKKKKRKMKTRRKQQPARSTGRLLRELGAGWWHCSMIVWWYYLLWRLVCRGWNLHLAKRRKSWDSYHQLRAPQNPPLGSWAWCSVKMLLPTPWTEAQRAAGCTPGKKHLPGVPAAQQSKPQHLALLHALMEIRKVQSTGVFLGTAWHRANLRAGNQKEPEVDSLLAN